MIEKLGWILASSLTRDMCVCVVCTPVSTQPIPLIILLGPLNYSSLTLQHFALLTEYIYIILNTFLCSFLDKREYCVSLYICT